MLLRDRLVDDLGRILGAAGIPALYVTHDHDEAIALADRVVLLRDGALVQSGTPVDVWRAPGDEWVAGFLGFGSAVDGRVVEGGVATAWGLLPLAATERSQVLRRVRVAVRPGGWRVVAAGPIRGRVVRSTFRGDRWEAQVVIDRSAPPVTVWSEEPLAEGAEIGLAVDAGGVVVFPNRVGREVRSR